MNRLRRLRVTRTLAVLLLVCTTAIGVGAGFLVGQLRGAEYSVQTDVLVRFWSIETYLLTGSSSSVSSLDVADAATLASSLDVLDAAATTLDDGRSGADLAKEVTVTAQTTSNSVTIVATAADAATATATSEAVANAMVDAVEDRIDTAAASLDDSTSDTAVSTELAQRVAALRSTVTPLEALTSGAAEQIEPNIKTALAMGVVGLAAGALVLVGLVFGRPVVQSSREAQRLLAIPAVPFDDAARKQTPPALQLLGPPSAAPVGGADHAAARVLRQLLDDRPTGRLLVVPIDAASDKSAQQLAGWARARTTSTEEGERLVVTPEPAGLVLRPRPSTDEVAAVLLVADAGVNRRDLTDAALLLRTWRAADVAVLATGSN